MSARGLLLALGWVSVFLGVVPDLDAEGPLPEFKLQGVVLHPNDLKYSPNEDLIHPTIVKTEGRVKNPLGKYYLYHAPHKHIATSLAYADSLEGPWTEYEQNPVVEGPSAPDVRWVEEHQKFFLWGHRKNSQTELWTSEDGLHFTYHSVSITAGNIGTRNASYSRMYEYPLEKYGSKYIMLYSGFLEDRGIRCVWLAHSKDAENWVPLKTPLVEPIAGEMNDCYGPSLFRWQGKNYVVYQDHTSWRGGNLKYVEVDQELSPVGAGGKRYVLMDPPDEPPLNNRIRGAEFYFEDSKIYLFTSASKNPRLIIYATAEFDEPVQDELKRLTQATNRSPTQATQTVAICCDITLPRGMKPVTTLSREKPTIYCLDSVTINKPESSPRKPTPENNTGEYHENQPRIPVRIRARHQHHPCGGDAVETAKRHHPVY